MRRVRSGRALAGPVFACIALLGVVACRTEAIGRDTAPIDAPASTTPNAAATLTTTALTTTALTTTTRDIRSFCATLEPRIVRGYFVTPELPDPAVVVDGTCVIDTRSPVGVLTMRPLYGDAIATERSKLESDPTVRRWIPQGERRGPEPTWFVRGEQTVWQLGTEMGIMISTEHCCVDAQSDMLKRIVGQYRVGI